MDIQHRVLQIGHVEKLSSGWRRTTIQWKILGLIIIIIIIIIII
jgi:tetrahydromethanopterin S-methyltransferase subunit A